MIENNFSSKLHLGCSNDPLFEKYNVIFFKDGKAHCTNGHIAIIQDLDLHNLTDEDRMNLEGKYIHQDTFKDLLKYKEVHFNPDNITAMTESRTEVIFNYYPYNGEWINIEEAFSGWSMNSIDEIAFFPEYLKRVSECLVKEKSTGLHFRFCAKNKGIIVTTLGVNGDKQKALLMPMMISVDCF